MEAARAIGAGSYRIIWRHLLPNSFPPVLALVTGYFGAAVVAETALSFLGLGSKDEPSWGVMIDDARLELSRDVWWQLAAATMAVAIISLALNVVGDAMRDALDPKLRT